MILGPPKGYTDLLDEATTAKLTQDKADGKDFQKTPVRPSAAGDCARALYHSLEEFHGKANYNTKVNEPTLHRLFDLGHTIESHVIRQFAFLKEFTEIRYKQQVLSFAYLEAKNDPSLSQWLEGSLDLVLWSDKYKCVADVKSKKDKFSSYRKSSWDETTEKLERMKTVEPISETAFWVENLEAFLEELADPFFEANFKQLNMYANSDFLVERGIDHASIFQYCKNDSRLREIRFKPSRALYLATISKMQNVITALDTSNPELAPKEYMLGSVKCAFCKYKATCWPGADAQKSFYQTLPSKRWPRDTDRMGDAGRELEELVSLHALQGTVEKERTKTETAILKLMQSKNVSKIRLDNGDVYEARQLKDSIVLRRSKA